MINCQFWWGILYKVCFTIALISCIWLKAIWYLHTRDWAIRITSMGLGDILWCRTIFLWFQIDQRVVKMVCRKHILSCSKSELDIIHWLSHCSTEVQSISEVLKLGFEPCQIALAQIHSKNRWTSNYFKSLHITQVPATRIPLSFSLSKVGKQLCSNFQMNIRTFEGNFIFQKKSPNRRP